MRVAPVLVILPFILGLGLSLRITDFINQFINEDSNQRQLEEVCSNINKHFESSQKLLKSNNCKYS